MSSDGSSGISQFESKASSEQWHHTCIQLLRVVLQHLVGFMLTFSKLGETGTVWLPLLAERFCHAEIQRTFTGRKLGQAKHLPTPGNPALGHLWNQKVIYQDQDHGEEHSFILRVFTFLKGTRLELVTSSLVRFLMRSSCSRWSWSFSCSSWERTFFSVAVVCVTEET